ncbi:hypothetical protein [Yinghuangia soli]|uniref:Uncharacterized protein n=1 Tax=Yinghuangia soli TaxID=2908204 RepID=A0AA41Q520_9ACTN|nr:hypothetical protein [Yinghuangia soli]MCF2531715.1 hypothetical protein [Yinghuangia soli]
MEDQPLSRLIQEALDGGLTVRELAARCIDPDSGYTPSKTLIGDIKLGHSVKLNPKLVAALAAGLGLDPQRVAIAAAVQFAGLRATQVFEGETAPDAVATVVHRPGAVRDGSRNRAHIDRIEQEEFGD